MIDSNSSSGAQLGGPVSRTCNACGHSLPADAPGGLCPVCLRREFLSDEPEAAPPPKAGDVFGDYQLLSQIARGGMGIVYRAHQRGLDRFVALKLIDSRQESLPEFVARFETEARAAASLDHPNVVPIYEIGEHDGRHFFTMKLVEGQSLSQRLSRTDKRAASRDAQEPLSVQECASLLAKVARAVHHAHQRGVLHRDLKPSNILLDAQGEPHLTDFGLACLLETDSFITKSSAAVGTPAYMSPEQAAGGARNLTTASDIFSLGGILYELLSGRPPFLGDTPLETMRKVVEEEPVPLRAASRLPLLQRRTRIEPLQSSRAEPAQAGTPNVDRDLEIICFKCLAKEAEARYPTALALAEDLERWLRREPIQARPVRPVERVLKWMRRRPKVAALVVLLNVVFALGLAGILWMSIRLAAKAKESHERLVRMNIAAGNRLVENSDYLSGLLWFSEALRLEQGDAAREEIHRYRLDATLRHSPRLLQVLFHEGALTSLEFSPDGGRLLTASEDKTARVWGVASGEPLTPPLPHEDTLGAACWSPDGRTALTMSRDGVAKVWDATSGQTIATLPQPADFRPVFDRIDPMASFSPDGRWVLTVFGSFAARVWEAGTGKLILTLAHSNLVYDAAFSPDGRFIITGSNDRTARIWEAATGKPTGVILRHKHWVNRVRFSADGARVLTVNDRKWLQVWDWAAGNPLSPPFGQDYVLFDASFSPDGQSVLSAGWDMTARLWETTTGRQFAQLNHPAGLHRARFSPDGTRIVTVSDDRGVRVWDSIKGKLMPSVLPGDSRVAFSSNGRLLATASLDGIVRVWDLSGGNSVIRTFSHDEVIVAEFSPDERYVVTASTGPEHNARVYDASTGQLVTPPMQHSRIVRQAVFSPDSRRLLTASDDGTARLWEVPTGKEICPPMQHVRPVRRAAFNRDGTRVVTACDDGAARIWDAASGRLAMPPLTHSNAVVSAEFSPDGRLIVTASLDQTARLWDAFTGKPISLTLLHPQPVYVAAFSPDGRRVVTVCSSQGRGAERTRSFGQVWDVATGQRRGSPLRHDHVVYYAEFGPDGRRVVTTSQDGTARVWDASTGRQLASSLRYGRALVQARFSPDGRRVAVGTSEGVVQILDAATGEAITPQLVQPALHSLIDLRFSADGQRLLIASGAQTVSLRSLPKTDLPVEDLLLQAQVLSGYKVEDVAGMVPLTPTELSNAWHTLRMKYPTMFAQEQPIRR